MLFRSVVHLDLGLVHEGLSLGDSGGFGGRRSVDRRGKGKERNGEEEDRKAHAGSLSEWVAEGQRLAARLRWVEPRYLERKDGREEK